MNSRYLELLIMTLLTAVCVCTCIFVQTTYQQRVDELNMRLVEARQEVADKTNRIYELHLELDGRSE